MRIEQQREKNNEVSAQQKYIPLHIPTHTERAQDQENNVFSRSTYWYFGYIHVVVVVCMRTHGARKFQWKREKSIETYEQQKSGQRSSRLTRSLSLSVIWFAPVRSIHFYRARITSTFTDTHSLTRSLTKQSTFMVKAITRFGKIPHTIQHLAKNIIRIRYTLDNAQETKMRTNELKTKMS